MGSMLASIAGDHGFGSGQVRSNQRL